MKSAALVSCLLIFAVASSTPNYESEWAAFKAKFGKKYADSQEDAMRFAVFKRNVDKVRAQNSQNTGVKYAVNSMSDLTTEEFASARLGWKKLESAEMFGGLQFLGNHSYNDEALPDSVDHVSDGLVTPIKDQGQCGSCWIFSAVGGLEGAYAKATGSLMALAEQQVLDCEHSIFPPTLGCSGGSMGPVFNYAKSHDMCKMESYAYQAKAGTCQMSTCTVGVKKGTFTGWKGLAPIGKLIPASYNAMMSAVAQQPVSVSIEADKDVFHHYSSGVVDGKCGQKPDHGVLVVGYGHDASLNKDYWKIKNSWGVSWGEQGYVRILRGAKGTFGRGECAVLNSPAYPVAASAADETLVEWTAYKAKFSKSYANAKDEAMRFAIFKANLDTIRAQNAKSTGVSYGLNSLSDLTTSEFASARLGWKMPDSADRFDGLKFLGNHSYNDEALPDSVDHVSDGLVTAIKDQGQCGSCWIFSAVGGLEGAYAKATGSLVALAEQQVLDCEHSIFPPTLGCSGGSMGPVFNYAKSHDMCKMESYKYQAKAGTCQMSTCTVGVNKGTFTGWKGLAPIGKLIPASYNAMMSAVAQQPVSVSIEADKDVFHHYSSGVVDGKCGLMPDHGVLVVGYGHDATLKKDYWKIKNSWGTSWGEQGYVRILRGASGTFGRGECAVLNSPAYPVAASAEVVV
jgi:C1A family cysteine protease